MKIKTSIPIGELLARLPEGSVTAYDTDCLWAVRHCIKALRTDPSPDHDAPFLFTYEMRHSLSLELTDAVAQIIQARIPRNGVGRPRTRGAVALDLQTFKRRALEMTEALTKFEKKALAAAAAEMVRAPPDEAERRTRLAPALTTVFTALQTLNEAPCSHEHLSEQVTDMFTCYDDLKAAYERWCASTVPAGGRESGVHKSNRLEAWIEASRKLSRDIAEELRATRA